MSILEIVEAAYQSAFALKKSRGDIRKLLQQGSVQLNGEKITDPFAKPVFAPGNVLKLDKTHAVRIGG
ncbi:hypothetical protein QQ056_04170 [Oscillatoria laete-virens NRMC-F 0139]|nr:S4 domain-containing protein [Oscillatoria laete-virens]MDL5052757.1 hypothetical protein [Oscillatoria laete-virens NRMC-F 0139]